MLRKVMQFWLLLVFIVLALGLQYYTEVQAINVTEEAKTITIGLPLMQQTYTLHLFVYSLALFLLAAALSTVHFGFELFRKGRLIKKLEKQLAETRPFTSTSSTSPSTSLSSGTDLEET